MVDAFVKLDKVSISYEQNRMVVSDLDLSLHTGVLHVLIGANGAGKSSLLRLISGIQKPQSGRVFWQGRDLKTIPLSDRAKLLGSLLRTSDIRVDMTLGEFICLGRIPHTGLFGKLDGIDIDMAHKAAKEVGMTQKWNHSIQRLSDGEFRKGQLAQLLAQDVAFFILDEPTSHLDVPSSFQLLNLLKDLTAVGKGVLLTTHDLLLAHRFANKMMLLHNSNLITGTPDLVREHASYRQFVGPSVIS